MAKAKPLEWTIEMAARECGVAPRTLSSRLTTSGTKPDAAGHFTTAQIIAALNGNIDAERLRKTKEEADKLELDNRRRRGELLDAAEVKAAIERICFIQRQNFMLSGMPPEVIERNLALNRSMESLDFNAPMPDDS